jgi:hypothetical protein
MSWLLEDAPGSDQVVVYEALLNQFFHGARAAGMCQYDRSGCRRTSSIMRWPLTPPR